jgi:hypothetical protein
MSEQRPAPSVDEINGFLRGLHEYRATLNEGHQHLLDAMVGAAIGKAADEEDVKPFWYAYNPPGMGPYNPPGYGYAVGGPYGGYAAGWGATPWGMAYGVRYW